MHVSRSVAHVRGPFQLLGGNCSLTYNIACQAAVLYDMLGLEIHTKSPALTNEVSGR